MISDQLPAQAVNRVFFRLAGGAQPLLLVPTQVNEQGSFEFILDTGSGTSLCSPEVAQAVQIKGAGTKEGHTAGGKVSVQLACVDSLSVGSAKVRGLQVAITDLRHIGRAVGAKIDGDIGYNFLKRFCLTINYRDSWITLEPSSAKAAAAQKASGQTEIKLRLASPTKPLILVDAHVNGRGPFQFAIDTGTSTTAISEELAADLHLERSSMPPVTTGGASIEVAASKLQSLRVGGTSQQDVSVIIGDFLKILSQVIGTKLDGIIGYNFLEQYQVVIDYPNEVLRLV